MLMTVMAPDPFFYVFLFRFLVVCFVFCPLNYFIHMRRFFLPLAHSAPALSLTHSHTS